MDTREWARFLDDSEIELIRRVLLRHVSDATWCSDDEAGTLTDLAGELATELTKRETANLAELYDNLFRGE